ncbi:MAG: DUF3667 domain-containing protein, partial [Chitinophagaceae bacterium]
MDHPESITCPNCGFQAERNFCAECGQATHLHKETFVGLVLHFIAHYFHFESKFWVTVKHLISRPGSLTLAYINKKRASFIPPISLYIFISAVFFLLMFLMLPGQMESEDKKEVGETTVVAEKSE